MKKRKLQQDRESKKKSFWHVDEEIQKKREANENGPNNSWRIMGSQINKISHSTETGEKK